LDGDYRKDPAEVYPVWDGFDGAEVPADAPPGAEVRALAGPVADQIKESLGVGVPRIRYKDRPDISGLAEGLGLR
jgi:hypothetical protein